MNQPPTGHLNKDRRAYRRAYYEANRVRIIATNIERWRRWAAANPEKERERCRRKTLKRKYRLSPDTFLRLYLMQGGRCGLCTEPLTAERHQGNSIVVDHDHVTNKVRSLLCHNCNVGLGHFGDSIEKMERGVNYLKEHAR